MIHEFLLAAVARARPADEGAARRAFYNSRPWLRYQILRKYGGRCQACGRTASDGVVICVDHVKSVRNNWELWLEPSNLQILCSDCNLAKASADSTDWRKEVNCARSERVA
jgi:5-methylcytosine-specific restriction endonuclease McrA